MECANIEDSESKEKTEHCRENLFDDIEAAKLEEVVSIRSEESITHAASRHIEETLCKLKDSIEKNSLNTAHNEKKIDVEQAKNELNRRVLIGEITPFQAAEAIKSTDSNNKQNRNVTSGLLGLEHYLKRQAELLEHRKKLKNSKVQQTKDTKGLKLVKKTKTFDKSEQCLKKRKIELQKCALEDQVDIEKGNANEEKHNTEANNSASRKRPIQTENDDSGSEYMPSDGEIAESDTELDIKKTKTKNKRRRKNTESESFVSGGKRILDDADEATYRERIEARLGEDSMKNSLSTVNNLFKVPKSIWKKLYEYQRVSVRWLWELHGRSLGGLLGDEMGLGKTVQVIAFLAGLDASELLSDGGRFRGLGPTLIVCPATLLEQWVKHFQDWAPYVRVVVLHHSGTHRGDPEFLIESIKRTGGIVITSYSGILGHKELLVANQWHYVILDEGHKIRNPEAKVSKTVKEFSTPHRLLLTGSPMQNSLKELWSLFDFILPGKLGTLPTFLEHCANPITRGGYANASPLQEATALQVATMLKDAIAPYMLRRTKNDVQHHISLPEKNEQVLFCSLTEEQKNLYKEYLRTDIVSSVLHDKSNHTENSYRARLLVALTTLKKICNHPDLYIYGKADDSDIEQENEEGLEKFGYWRRSGKLAVVRSLLKIWKRQGHRVLLFTQGRQMMHVLEAHVQRESYRYLRLDATTPMAQRQQIIHKFNNNPEYFIFISTTRVGGLGVNLTGANRVIIYDPDWNPAIDAQARERAWRIGQDKRVTIYRLVTAGTVEEKIYHRQIFKLLLSNRVLEDPRQRRLFQTSDLAELFNLHEPIDGKTTESDRIFRDYKLKPGEPNFSASKVEAMKKLASTVSKRIEENVKNERKEIATIVKDNAVPEIQNDEENNSLPKNSPPENETIAEVKPVEISVTEVMEGKNRRKKHGKKHKKNKTEPEVAAIFEGEKVPCLIGRRIGHSTPSEEEQLSSTCDDQYVLMKLFAKTKVSSAFQHDAVISGARSDGSQVNPMEKMARQAAQESMDQVRQSRKWCWRPTWDSPKDNNDV